jgi:hypothetical protein
MSREFWAFGVMNVEFFSFTTRVVEALGFAVKSVEPLDWLNSTSNEKNFQTKVAEKTYIL